MDNLRPHLATAIGKTLERAHLGLLYLPRYSPDLCLSRKQRLR